MPAFIFSSADEPASVEKAAVRHAIALGDSMRAESAVSLEELMRLDHGALAQQRPVCPAGSVEFCEAWMRAVGVTPPKPVDYPDVLQEALGRVIRLTTYGQATIGSWVKPVKTKAWEAHIKQAEETHPSDEAVWESAVIHPHDWLSEWRVYVLNGRILGVGRYDAGEDDAPEPDWDLVRAWAARWIDSGTAPRAFALDVARWSRRTVLVEATDAWAAGYYRGTCKPLDYAHWLYARWGELAGLTKPSGADGCPPPASPSAP